MACPSWASFLENDGDMCAVLGLLIYETVIGKVPRELSASSGLG